MTHKDLKPGQEGKNVSLGDPIEVNRRSYELSVRKDIPTQADVYAYRGFNLLCMPCFASVGAMKCGLKTLRAIGAVVGSVIL